MQCAYQETCFGLAMLQAYNSLILWLAFQRKRAMLQMSMSVYLLYLATKAWAELAPDVAKETAILSAFASATGAHWRT